MVFGFVLFLFCFKQRIKSCKNNGIVTVPPRNNQKEVLVLRAIVTGNFKKLGYTSGLVNVS